MKKSEAATKRLHGTSTNPPGGDEEALYGSVRKIKYRFIICNKRRLETSRLGNFKTIVNKTDIRLEQSISFNTSAVRRQAPIKVIGINSEDQ